MSKQQTEITEQQKPDGAAVTDPATVDAAPATEVAGGQPPVAGAAPAEGDKPGAAPAAAAQTPKKPDWKDSRISNLTAQKKALDEKVRQLESRLTQRAGEPDAAFEARVTAEAERRAAELTQRQSFISECNKTFEAGKAEFPDFPKQLEEFKKIAPEDDSAAVTAYTNLVVAALEAGNAHRILYLLSQDLDETQRIMKLSPVKQGIELARLADKEAPSQVSRAPAPIKPIASRGAAHTAVAPDDPERASNLAIDVWMARRTEQANAEFKRRRGF